MRVGRNAAAVGLLALGTSAAACANLSYEGLGETATSPPPSSTASPTASGTLYASDFESGDGGLQTTEITGTLDSWKWGVPSGGAHSGTHAWATNLTGNYLEGEQSCLALPLTIPMGGAKVYAWVSYTVESGWDYFDIRICDSLGACQTVDQNMDQAGFREYVTDLNAGAQTIEWCVVAEGLFPTDGLTVDDVRAIAN